METDSKSHEDYCMEEEIKQNQRTVLHSNDGISIPMIFNNLVGRNLKADEYKTYIRNIAFGEMGFMPGIVELYKGGVLTASGTIPAL